ncbi:TRAP transporter small permease [Rhizobium tubonense]|uniref:TRAP transporter small permease protein n=1 Tax=Rhizobium tubonense TaxID=484088 RepID=A0A2W4F0A2_9HYPH|nr:TRAP transporter small permease [Rhizobium tubonense]PZM15490.1 C4-dicarboxylate ABC transporter permease [Rhizobium tubonense]
MATPFDAPPANLDNARTTTNTRGKLGAYFAFHAWLSRICLKTAVAGTLLIVAAVLYQIFGRYVLNDSPAWTEIFALVVILYVTCLAAAVGVRDGRHIGMDSLLNLAPEPFRLAAEIIVYLGMVVFGLSMAWSGAELAVEMAPYINAGLPISQAWSYVPLAVGGVLIALFAIERIVAAILKIKVIPSWH